MLGEEIERYISNVMPTEKELRGYIRDALIETLQEWQQERQEAPRTVPTG